jgi:hypothetical protein
MRYSIALIACALPLTACSKGPTVHEENASVAEVQREIAQAGGTGSFVRPGLWESKVTIEEMTMPGMPAEMASQMKGLSGQIEAQQSCLTPEEAKRPKEDFFAGENKNCRYDRFTMAGGKIDAVMKCTEERASQTMTMQGDYTGDTYNMRMSMKAEGGEGPVNGMTMRMRVDARRVGECTGKEAA